MGERPFGLDDRATTRHARVTSVTLSHVYSSGGIQVHLLRTAIVNGTKR